VLEAADEMIERAFRTGEPLGIFLTADSGMGKTVLLENIALRLRKRFASISNDDPLFGIECEANADVFKLASAFLQAMGYPVVPAKSNLEAMTKMVDTALKRVKRQAALIDEAQHMCEGCRDITARTTTDWLKLRMDKNCLSYFLAGAQGLARLRHINPQFASRASADFVISTFRYGPVWLQLLGGLADKVKSVDMAVLKDRRVAKRVYDGAPGNLRRLKRWLGPATVQTLAAGRKALSLDDLRRGFDVAFGSNGDNPFAEKL
jgi:hypothetical protein